MYAIVTVTGSDHPGIVAGVTSALAEHKANILDISQTLMGGFFTMILRVEVSSSIDELQEGLAVVEREQATVIRVQSEDLFTAMNEL
ncbi:MULTISPECIES: ACT domain-containing protein [Trueperella]|uniref:ACT domain-containing protein n=1 Tax=Trueperella abortisuis TaxID=445930 RepID=A0ABT9PG12_9ACTO|nr:MULTISPECIES: ACT domain-containing protein [Trueperella]MCI7305080.1 ACT domain-containing protein [Trueperella sp.]MDP9831648.1 ACT domain-containing protein [Trueperella abortisuis]MDY5403673.1 ACT domain-containing protein [Trueperella sp.]